MLRVCVCVCVAAVFSPQRRALYMLNAEKTDYNYRVLQERDAELEAAVAAQKRKIKRLHVSLQFLGFA